MSHCCLSVFYIKSFFVGKMDSETYYLPMKKGHQTGVCSTDPDPEEPGAGRRNLLTDLKLVLVSYLAGNYLMLTFSDQSLFSKML